MLKFSLNNRYFGTGSFSNSNFSKAWFLFKEFMTNDLNWQVTKSAYYSQNDSNFSNSDILTNDGYFQNDIWFVLKNPSNKELLFYKNKSVISGASFNGYYINNQTITPVSNQHLDGYYKNTLNYLIKDGYLFDSAKKITSGFILGEDTLITDGEDNCSYPYRVYDGYQIDNPIKITNGVPSSHPAIIVNKRLIGNISHLYITSGYRILNNSLTPISNTQISRFVKTVSGSIPDNHHEHETISNTVCLLDGYRIYDGYYSPQSIINDNGNISLSGKIFLINSGDRYLITNNGCSIIENTSQAPSVMYDGYVVGNPTLISGSVYLLNNWIITDGYIITSGYTIRESVYENNFIFGTNSTNYLLDGYYIQEGLVGTGTPYIAEDPLYDTRMIIAYSARSGFGSTGFNENPVSATNPPIANDMVWLHKDDNNPGLLPLSYYYPNAPQSNATLLNPGLPDFNMDKNNTESSITREMKWGDEVSGNSWNVHLCGETTTSFFYMLWTMNEKFISLLCLDEVNGVENEWDNTVFINMPENPRFWAGSSRHSVYIKGWFGAQPILSTRSDFVNEINTSNSRFLETGILHLLTYNDGWISVIPNGLTVDFYTSEDTLFPLIYCKLEDESNATDQTLVKANMLKGTSTTLKVDSVRRNDFSTFFVGNDKNYISINFKENRNTTDLGTTIALPWDGITTINY